MSDKKMSTFTFLIEKELKETFKKVCKANDDEASKILRRFIRDYINKNRQGTLQ